MNSKVNKVINVVRASISGAVNVLIQEGGNFNEFRNNVVNHLVARYPGLDAGTLYGGFDHEYVQALQKRVS